MVWLFFKPQPSKLISDTRIFLPSLRFLRYVLFGFIADLGDDIPLNSTLEARAIKNNPGLRRKSVLPHDRYAFVSSCPNAHLFFRRYRSYTCLFFETLFFLFVFFFLKVKLCKHLRTTSRTACRPRMKAMTSKTSLSSLDCDYFLVFRK